MLIAKLTDSGATRVLDGYRDQHLPVVDAFRRAGTNDWCLGVADFRYHQSMYLPFQPWSLGPEDYVLKEAKYDGMGWSFEDADRDAALPAVERP